jgi:hypothetical protein
MEQKAFVLCRVLVEGLFFCRAPTANGDGMRVFWAIVFVRHLIGDSAPMMYVSVTQNGFAFFVCELSS